MLHDHRQDLRFLNLAVIAKVTEFWRFYCAETAKAILYPRLPMRIRAVGPYQEALARLQGERQPDLAVRWLNRLWIGRPMME
jgi:hypothetical protein